MDEMDVRVLTLISYGDNDEEIVRVTIAPQNVAFLIANTVDVVKFGLRLKKTNVMLMDGGSVELFITDMDLTTLERAVGTYMLP